MPFFKCMENGENSPVVLGINLLEQSTFLVAAEICTA